MITALLILATPFIVFWWFLSDCKTWVSHDGGKTWRKEW